MTTAVLKTMSQVERAELLADAIVQQITDLIVSNQLKQGDQLVESFLAEQFGVSRVPVREGLRKLEQMGLVSKEPYHPAVVSELTLLDIQQLHETRLIIEPNSAYLLAKRQPSQALEKLTQIFQSMQAASEQNKSRAFIDLDAEFHDSLVVMTGNTLLGEMWSLASLRLRRFLFLKNRRAYDDLSAAVEMHRPIHDAILQGDAGLAEQATREHIVTVFQSWQSGEEQTQSNSDLD